MDGSFNQTPVAAQPQQQAPVAKTPTAPVPPLSIPQKQEWNRFLDFVDKEGFKGNPALDDKDKKLGQYLMQKYNTLNPKSTITYADVPRVQSELQQYRTEGLKDIHDGKIQADIKSDDEFMPGLSPVDGWLGSKTSSFKFPTAKATSTVNGKTTTQDFGVDTKKYDEQYLAKKSK